MLGGLPALSLYCSDPLSSPPLSQHWKREESKALPISLAIHAAIGSQAQQLQGRRQQLKVGEARSYEYLIS